MRSSVEQGLGGLLSALLNQLQGTAIALRRLLQFSHRGFVQDHWSREAYDMRATLQKLKFLQPDSGKEQDNMVLVSSFCYLHLRCIRT